MTKRRPKVEIQPHKVNTGNFESRLRRIRMELAQMLAQTDERLMRIRAISLNAPLVMDPADRETSP